MTQTIVVFSGPTLVESRILELLPGARCLGPAACGDVYRAAKLGPSVIALIDGYFDHRLSVWHKELLWALSQGIRVYGAASMGALRAAELVDHGMIGVGVVYEQFRRGILEDDDEVAVTHAAPERNFLPQSLAMVNIRASLRRALAAGIIDSADEARLISAGKAMFYPDRSFNALLRTEAGLSHEATTRLRDWLAEHGAVDQKALDAEALLRRVRADLDAGAASERVAAPAFVRTNYWETLRNTLDRESLAPPADESPAPPAADFAPVPPRPDAAFAAATDSALQALLERDPAQHFRLRAEAAEAALALVVARREGARVTPSEAQAESHRLRSKLGLRTPDALRHWLELNGLGVAEFSALIARRVLASRFAEDARTLANDPLGDSLLLSGTFRDTKVPSTQ